MSTAIPVSTRSCPICDASAPNPLFRQRFAPIDGATIISGYDVVTCENCGFAYADGLPEQSTFDDYYRAASKYEYHQRDGEESPYDRSRMSDIADMIIPLIPRSDAHILDIGCATGRLLYLLKERGFRNVTGLDPSPGCADAARRLYGVPVLQGSMSEFPRIDAPFDVAILIGVLEHIRDLDVAMHRIRSVLNEDGLVYVEVPNALDFYRFQNAPFQDFSVEHINFFAPVSLGNLFARYGFEPVFWKEHARDQSYRTTMSCLSAAFRVVGTVARAPAYDRDSRGALERYVRQCEQDEKRVAEAIDALVESKKPVIVWGVGTNATRLLETTRLGDANIRFFVDSNARYHGKELAGRPVLSPAAAESERDAILILSRVFQAEISEQIRAAAGADREILTLYDVR
jgi:SAM-dependent methyltransferase